MTKSNGVGRGGAREGSGRKHVLTDFERWEASNLCDFHELKQRKEWALRQSLGLKKLQQLRQAWSEINDPNPDAFPIWLRQDQSPTAKGLIRNKIEDIRLLLDEQNKSYSPTGRPPAGILGREKIIAVVARYLGRKWERPVSANSVRAAWKTTRSLWRHLDEDQDQSSPV